MKIGLASSDWSFATEKPSWGGAGWARLGLPGAHLGEAMGAEVVSGTLTFSRDLGVFGVREWTPIDEDDVIHWDVDLIVLQRWMFASVAVETTRAQAAGQVVVQDVDDDFWSIDPRNRAAARVDPRLSPIENRDHYLAAIKAASLVTVSTPALAAALRRLGVRTEIQVLPNHVDVEAFPEASPVLIPVVGWVGATPWRSGDLGVLRGILGPWFHRSPRVLLYHGGHIEGAPSFAAEVGLDEAAVRTRPMVPIEEYPSLLEPISIGLAPLRDIPFNRAKSWIKGLEYAAAGIPSVASDLPEYRRLQEEYGIGRVVRRPRDWIRHLDDLVDGAWVEEGHRARQAAQALDIRRGIHLWRDVYLEHLAAV